CHAPKARHRVRDRGCRRGRGCRFHQDLDRGERGQPGRPPPVRTARLHPDRPHRDLLLHLRGLRRCHSRRHRDGGVPGETPRRVRPGRSASTRSADARSTWCAGVTSARAVRSITSATSSGGKYPAWAYTSIRSRTASASISGWNWVTYARGANRYICTGHAEEVASTTAPG